MPNLQYIVLQSPSFNSETSISSHMHLPWPRPSDIWTHICKTNDTNTIIVIAVPSNQL